MVLKEIRSAYYCRRLNPSTFLIIHNDKFDEHRFVYAKLYNHPWLLVLVDTGCGPSAAADPQAKTKDLRSFIESVPVADNGDAPLNPAHSPTQRCREYLVILTHCHYDHIGGIEPFIQAPQSHSPVASGYDPEFAGPSNRSKNSLCDDAGMPVPEYSVAHMAKDFEWLKFEADKLGLQAIQTPGHTPDSVAIYDIAENVVFVGDSFYRRKCQLLGSRPFTQPIIFPPQGDWRVYERSLVKLNDFITAQAAVQAVRATDSSKRIRVACSHTTEDAPALHILESVLVFFREVVNGHIPIAFRAPRNGEMFAFWQRGEDPEFSLFAPERLLEEYRGHSE